MLKANDFRVGNKLFYNTEEGLEVTTIDWEDIKMASKNNDYFNKYYSPIPLTEEWLIKMGFEKIKNKDYMTLFLLEDDEKEFGRQRIDFWFGEDDFQAAELCRAGVCFKRVKMKFVHQMQNLTYALTNEELTIKN
jgi:hypothetical protein